MSDIAIPRNPTHMPTEASRLLSPRDPGSMNHLYKTVRQGQSRVDQLGNIAAQLQQQTNKLQSPQLMVGSGLFPFRIYQMPDYLRETPLADPATIWRAVRVRSGLILNATVDPTNLPAGTDTIDQPYDDVFASQADGTPITGVVDIIVPEATQNYWFWIDLDANEVCYGADPTDPDSGTAWGTFPTADGSHVVIGWCDTLTLGTQGQMIIRQIQNSDVQSAGGAGSPTTLVYFVASFDDYIVCQNSFADTYYPVIKPWKIRNSNITGPSGVTYVYGGDYVSRVATGDPTGSPENQVLTPPYYAGDEVACVTIPGGVYNPGSGSLIVTISADTYFPTGTVITLLQMSPQPAWTQTT